MKNLFLLPTDKPSRLHYYFELNKKYTLSKEPLNWKNASHVYITSDEEIKEGDWYFDGADLVHKKTKYNDSLVDGNKQAKKIILTTDQDLIKDGVQTIDDEFLEWFVKNPSCDEVEVETYFKKIGVETDANGYRAMDVLGKDYKIIIPKEEQEEETDDEEKEFRRKFPKEFALIDMIKLDEAQEKPKQETFEEVAERLFPFTKDDSENRIITIKRLFWIDGAKWQAEQDKNKYSEEDMHQIVLKTVDRFCPVHSQTLKMQMAEEWFEQFKKKA